jgi:MoaA/NifB/PqqE/SkfB family radical SAM enzyme
MLKIFNIKSSLATDMYVIKEGLSFLKNHTIGQNINAFKFFFNRNKPLTKLNWNPITTTIAIESRCNQTCKYCHWHSREIEREYWPLHLNMPDFKKIINILSSNNVAHAHLCATGETILNENVIKMLKYIKKKKMTSSLTSNMAKEFTPLIDEIAQSGISKVFTDLDSGDPDQFEEYDEGSSWKIVINNLKKLAKARKKYKKNYRIGVYCIAMKSNVHTYKNLMRTAKKCGVDDVIFSYLQPHEANDVTSTANQIKAEDKDLWKKIDNAVNYGRKLGLRVYPPRCPPKSKTRIACQTMWFKLMINLPNDKIPHNRWIGNASSHCLLTHYGDAYSYGNIIQDGFDNVWNGKKLQKFRKKLLTNAPKICRDCPAL